MSRERASTRAELYDTVDATARVVLAAGRLAALAQAKPDQPFDLVGVNTVALPLQAVLRQAKIDGAEDKDLHRALALAIAMFCLNQGLTSDRDHCLVALLAQARRCMGVAGPDGFPPTAGRA